MNPHGESQSYKPKWYFMKEEIEEHSPSRKDGISHEQESHLRQLCCSYLQDLGMELKVPQVTIATTMVLCHRFYMHQSHAKNHWQAVANASMFLACKTSDTPRWLRDLVVVAYKLMYCWDPSAAQRIRQKALHNSLLAVQTTLHCSRFDFLCCKTSEDKIAFVKWESLVDAINVSPKQLEEVIQHMLRLLGQGSKRAHPFPCNPENKIEPICRKRKSESTESCISDESIVQDSRNFTKAAVLSTSEVVKSNIKQADVDANDTLKKTENCGMNYSGSTDSVVKDGDYELITEDSYQKSGCKIISVKESCQNIDIAGLGERLKRRKSNTMETKKSRNEVDEEINSEAWIERELESGIELVYAS